MGYRSPKAFSMRAQGFEATLGGMQSANLACWHVFKKGFCRHADACCKQHPTCQVPIHVLVEGVQLQAPKHFSGEFKALVADLAVTASRALGDNPIVESAEAFKDKDYQGWTIELTAKKDLAIDKEDVLSLAKNALLGAIGNSKVLYIIGCSAKPFMRKSRGFVTILGNMQDQSRACWNLYSKGACNSGCECCYVHPECMIPVNVVVKEMSFPFLKLNEALHCLPP